MQNEKKQVSQQVKLGSRWKHKRTGREYRVTQINQNRDDIYLECESKGGRSTWKYIPLLPWDYELIGGTEGKAGAK